MELGFEKRRGLKRRGIVKESLKMGEQYKQGC